MKQTLSSKPNGKQGFVSAKDIRDTFKELEIELPLVEYDYIVLKMFEIADNVDKFDFQQLFQKFVNDQWLKEDEAAAGITHWPHRLGCLSAALAKDKKKSDDMYEDDEYEQDK